MKASMTRKLGLALLTVMMLGGVVACDNEGPAEKTGENIDKAMEDTGESMKELGEEIQDSVQKGQN
ncbi:hypothetical protein [Litchfieldella rifensis]|uniref:Uncharacterized protein n=1 Tax=Litchfieldella rifensis TaxID=762643 RepID=A0ABV7LP27_9GAMM